MGGEKGEGTDKQVKGRGGFMGDGVRESRRESLSLRSSLGAVTGRIRQRCDSLGRRDADKMDDKLRATQGE